MCTKLVLFTRTPEERIRPSVLRGDSVSGKILYRIFMKFIMGVSYERLSNTPQFHRSPFSNIILYLLTPWCRVLLEKLTGSAASQEIPRISRNPKVHYRTHKRPSPVSILGQPNPVHIPTSHLPEIHPNIISPSTPRSPQWPPSLRFPHQDPIHPLSSPISATCPACLILLDFITRTIILY